MPKLGIIERITDKYFEKNMDLHVQTFNLLAFMGIIGVVCLGVISLFLSVSIAIIIIDLTIAALIFFFFHVAELKKCYRLCSWMMIILVFMIAFPLLYFRTGGYRGGMPPYFVLAICFTTFLLVRLDLIISVSLELLIFIFCFIIEFLAPQTVVSFPYEVDYISLTIVGFATSGVLLMIVVVLRTRIYNDRQTQVRELNRELKIRNETLIRYDMMKSDFLATVAHEINTPLAIITASSADTLDLLDETPLNVDEIIENQKLIERRVRHIDSILLDLMDTVAIENGRISLSRQPVDLAELLRGICDPIVKRTDLKGNTFAYDFPTDLPNIWVDPPRIEQVLGNLLSNSLNHTKDGHITVKLERKDDNQIVSVIDTGDGMDEETARVVLKQYVSTKADYWRHGIGLYICRRIIMAHGGDIWINSAKGRGTTVSFSLREDPDYG